MKPLPAFVDAPREVGAMPGIALGKVAKGFRGTVLRVGGDAKNPELERRLLEIGFVEGAQIEILHEGLFGRDPIAVRVDDTTIALRRAEANHIVVIPHG